MIKVGVIFGGESVEHEVSIISAVQAMEKLDTEKYEIIPIYITKEREWYTGEILKDIETYQDLSLIKRYAKNVILYFKGGRFVLQKKTGIKRVVKDIDIILPVVHGTNVEDGCLQGYLRTIGIPFVGSDVASSAVGQDKIFQKQIWSSYNLPMAKYEWFYDGEYEENSDEVVKKIEKSLDYPVIVKPATLGSSVGIEKAKNKEELTKAIEEVLEYDTKFVVEEVIQNLTEVNISVLGNYEKIQLSEIEQVISGNDLLTYDDKYLGNAKKGASKGMASSKRKIPADITEKQKEEIEKIASKAFRALNVSGVVRIDFLIDSKTKKVYINEINTCPGSLSFYLWDAKGKKYPDLLDELINLGIRDYKKRCNKVHSFNTNILNGYSRGFKGVKGFKGKLK